MATIKAFQGAHSGPQWSGVQQLMVVDSWKLVVVLDVLCACMEGRSHFLGKKGKTMNIFVFMHKVNDFWQVNENDIWWKPIDGTLCHLAETKNGSSNGFHHTAFGRWVVLAKGRTMP